MICILINENRVLPDTNVVINEKYTFPELNDEGDLISVNKSTGEVVEMVHSVVPVGTRQIEPDEQEAIKRKCEEARRRATDPDGTFYWLHAKEKFEGLKSETIIRLIFLSTYCDYQGILRQSERGEAITKKDLPKLLRISESSCFRFLKEVSGRYLAVNPDGSIIVTSESIIRGKLKTKSDSVFDFFRVYRKNIRQLYRACKPSSHKRLGYVFQLLPYINRKYNIISANPDVTDFKKVIPLSFHDFCRKINYDSKHEYRLMNEYRKTKFVVDGEEQTLISIVLPIEEKNMNEGKMIINPRILYGGTAVDKIEVFNIFYNRQLHF